MMRLRYYLHIDVDERAMPADIIHAIYSEAEPHDQDWSAKVRRYIGGDLSDAAGRLADTLPEGVAVRIDDAPVVDQVML